MTPVAGTNDLVETTPAGGSCLFQTETWHQVREALSLSPRELQIVQSVFDDDSELVISRKLSISRHTVHTYMERVYRKLDVQSRVALVVRVIAVLQKVNHADVSADQGTAQ